MTPSLVSKPDGEESLDETHPLLPRTTPESSSPPQQPSELYGYLLMGLSCLGFSGMSLFVRIAEDKFHFPPLSSVFVRAVIQSALAYLYMVRFLDMRRVVASLTPTQWKLLAFRGLVGSFGIAALFTAISKLPVGDAVTVFFVNPVLTMILSNIVMSEPITPIDMIAAATSFAGIVLIARPSVLNASTDIDPTDRLVGSLWAFVAAFLSAFAYTTVRFLGTGIHFMTSVFSLGFASIFTSIALGGFITPAALFQHKEGSLAIILSSVFAFAGQCCLNKGLQYCRAGPGVLVRNLDVPLAYILGMLFLGEAPSLMRLFGSVLVLSAAVMIGVRQMVRRN